MSRYVSIACRINRNWMPNLGNGKFVVLSTKITRVDQSATRLIDFRNRRVASRRESPVAFLALKGAWRTWKVDGVGGAQYIGITGAIHLHAKRVLEQTTANKRGVNRRIVCAKYLDDE